MPRLGELLQYVPAFFSSGVTPSTFLERFVCLLALLAGFHVLTWLFSAGLLAFLSFPLALLSIAD